MYSSLYESNAGKNNWLIPKNIPLSHKVKGSEKWDTESQKIQSSYSVDTMVVRQKLRFFGHIVRSKTLGQNIMLGKVEGGGEEEDK